jgi:hypothetical protein
MLETIAGFYRLGTKQLRVVPHLAGKLSAATSDRARAIVSFLTIPATLFRSPPVDFRGRAGAELLQKSPERENKSTSSRLFTLYRFLVLES